MAEVSKRYEYVMAFLAMAWGSFLLNPGINTFASGSVFRNLAGIAPEETWGILFLLFGFVSIFLIRWDSPAYQLMDDRCQNPLIHILKPRKVVAFLNIFAWSLLAVTYFLGSPSNTGFVVYGFLAIISLLNYIEAYHYD